MRNPTHAEALTAHMYRDSVHPDVAIATYIRFMGLIEDWQADLDPFVQWRDYTRQDFDDVMQDLMELYEEKKAQ